MEELKPWEHLVRRWFERHPKQVTHIDQFIAREEQYQTKYPGAEFPYWGTICMLMAATGPCYLLFLLALIPALVFGGPWVWISGCMLAAALFFTFAAVVVWSEDRATLRKRGWFD